MKLETVEQNLKINQRLRHDSRLQDRLITIGLSALIAHKRIAKSHERPYVPM